MLEPKKPESTSQGGDAAAESVMPIFDLSPDLLGTANREGYFTSVNPAWEKTLGFSREAMMAQPFIEFVHPDDREATMAEMAKLVEHGRGSPDFRNRYARAGGGWCWLAWRTEVREEDDDGYVIFVARDVTDQIATEQRHRLLAAIVENSEEAIFTKTLDHTITSWNPAAERIFGFPAEEAVGRSIRDLIVPPERMGEPDAIISRLRRGQRVHRFTTERITADGDRVRVALTATLIRDDGGEPVGAGVISRDIGEQVGGRAELSSLVWLERIREAIAEDRLEFFAQPIVCLRGEEADSVELLCRLRDREGTIVPPGEFLPAAEELGAIEDIDRLAVRKGAELAASGQCVNVNLSALTIAREDFADYVEEELRRHDADPSRLVIEITESALMEDLRAAERFAAAAGRLGCRLSLDDFGTGFGGFTYLKRLAFDQLKIDREFVRDVTTSHASQHVVKAVVSLAEAFGLEAVAEGVEDERTLDLVRRYGVRRAQGFFLGRPGPLGETA